MPIIKIFLIFLDMGFWTWQNIDNLAGKRFPANFTLVISGLTEKGGMR
jgi:hypothetical protein